MPPSHSPRAKGRKTSKGAVRHSPDGGKGRFYESIAQDWDSFMDRHELAKRMRLIFDGDEPLLDQSDIEGRLCLDAGSGTGHFSRALSQRGARLVSMDVGSGLLGQVQRKCGSRAVQASLLDLPFSSRTFETILCTEVIEHTADPQRAVMELCRVLAPGGVLALTVPNRLLRFAVTAADWLGVRPYAGLENWVGYRQLSDWLAEGGVRVARQFGFNLLPHTFFCRPGFDFIDRLEALHPAMVNIAVRCAKPGNRG